MTEFKLEISRDNTTFYNVDLFPQQQLEYDLDFYDSLEADKVKLPFYTKLRIPLTTNNKASNRFNFDPETALASAFPRDDFYFNVDVYGSSTTRISGILNVMSFEYNSSQAYIEVELKDFLSKYITEIKDLKLGDLYTDTYHTSRQTFLDFSNETAASGNGEAGVIDTNPDYTRPISFSYIDFCNDVDGKFGYAERQFLEYGPFMNRGGLSPVFSVGKFLEYVGAYVNSTNFPVRVDSKLFALGSYDGNPAFEDMQPEKLHFLAPAQLLAKNDTNTRNFFVRQSPAWVGVNENLDTITDENNITKLIKTNYFGNMETAGNYGTDAEGNPLYDDVAWGSEKRMGFYPDDDDEGIRGFVVPRRSFNTTIGFNSGNTSASPTNVKLEIPVVEEDKMVKSIDLTHADSTMTFRPYLGVFEDGLMVKKIGMVDASGDLITLGIEDISNTSAGNSNKDTASATLEYDYFAPSTEITKGMIIGVGAAFEDTLEFSDSSWYMPSNEELFVNLGGQYSVNYFVEPLEGTLRVNYVSEYSPVSFDNYYIESSNADGTFSVTDIRKAITRADDYGQLNMKFTSNEDVLLDLNSDEFIISDSINQTCPLTVSEIFSAILKRFDCGVFYEYDSAAEENVLRIDPLKIMRLGSQNVNALIDDLKSAKITIGGDRVKTLELNNEDYDLYFDDLDNDDITIGSTTQDINTEGISEIKIDFKSSVYYRSVCGDDATGALSEDNLGAFSAYQLGYTTNLFTPFKDVGLRFGYLDKPKYTTKLLSPIIKLKGRDTSGKMQTESEVCYRFLKTMVFNGRLTTVNPLGYSVMFESQGSVTDMYTDVFSDSEKILQAENPRIEFDIVVPTTDLADLDFFFQTLSATRLTPNSILVKSASGDVFDDYAYLTIEGILQ